MVHLGRSSMRLLLLLVCASCLASLHASLAAAVPGLIGDAHAHSSSRNLLQSSAIGPLSFKFPNGKCIDIPTEKGDKDGTVLQEWGCNGGTSQRFTLVPLGDTWYNIKSPLRRCLTVPGPSKGTRARLAACNASDPSQMFSINDVNGISFTLRLKLNLNQCLDADGYLQVWDCNMGSTQMMTMKHVQATASSFVVGLTKGPGQKTSTWRTSTGAAVNQATMCVGFSKDARGSRLIQTACSTLTKNKFTLVPITGSSWYSIKSYSGLCVDVDNAGGKGAAVQLWTCTEGLASQAFGFFDVAGKRFSLRPRYDPSLCIDVEGVDWREGTDMQVWTCNKGVSQLFTAGGSAACPGPTATGYTFYQGVDSDGNDQIGLPQDSSLSGQLSQCNGNAGCLGFNTNGVLKTLIRPRYDWNYWSSDPCKGLYVKQGPLAALAKSYGAGATTDDDGYSHDAGVQGSSAYGSRWMAALPGSLRISQLSIPGTHDTMTYTLPDELSPNTQQMSLTEQLQSGIRALDIRCRNYNGVLEIHHASYYLRKNFDDVLIGVRSFLAANKNETILMRVNEEHSDTGDAFGVKFAEYVARYPGLFWNASSPGSDAPNPALSSVRGKIVVLQKFDFSPVFGILYNSTMIQDDYASQSFQWNWDKWVYIQRHLANAINGDTEVLYLNYISGSGLGLPYFVAGGKETSGTNAAQLRVGCTMGRIRTCPDGRYIDYPSVSCASVTCSKAFLGSNQVLEKWGGWDGGNQRVGVVFMDFPGEQLIQKILASNA